MTPLFRLIDNIFRRRPKGQKGEVCYFRSAGQDRKFSNPDNWRRGRMPKVGDEIMIMPGQVCEIGEEDIHFPTMVHTLYAEENEEVAKK